MGWKKTFFKSRVQQARKISGLDWTEISQRTGIPEKTMWHWGNPSIPKPDKLVCFAEIVGVSPAWLLFGDEISPPSPDGREAAELIENVPEDQREPILALLRALQPGDKRASRRRNREQSGDSAPRRIVRAVDKFQDSIIREPIPEALRSEIESLCVRVRIAAEQQEQKAHAESQKGTASVESAPAEEKAGELRT